MRRLVSGGLILSLAVLVAGCKSDERENLVKNVASEFDSLKLKVESLQTVLTEAIKKGEAEKSDPFKLDKEQVKAFKDILVDIRKEKDGNIAKFNSLQAEVRR